MFTRRKTLAYICIISVVLGLLLYSMCAVIISPGDLKRYAQRHREPEPIDALTRQPQTISTTSYQNNSSVELTILSDESAKVSTTYTKTTVLDKSNVVAALYSGHSNWKNRNGLYRTVSCPKLNSTITITNAMWDVEAASEADVVMFAHGTAYESWEQLQERRRPNQIWLYTTDESIYHCPPVSRQPTVVVKNLRFNMSCGYHLKSEVKLPFGSYFQKQGHDQATKVRYGSKPTNGSLIAWMSSRDHMYWDRKGFVHDLAKYISVDMYGTSGDMSLPRQGNTTNILKQYRFFLALENSCCSYYITEKFWKALASYEAIPIVIGPSKEDYEKVAPPGSFIYADDFKSFEELATYITKLAENVELYDKYHEWRENWDVKVNSPAKLYPFTNDNACLLLSYLQNEPLKGMDPYGSDWLGSCRACGKNKWLSDYGRASKTFQAKLDQNKHIL